MFSLSLWVCALGLLSLFLYSFYFMFYPFWHFPQRLAHNRAEAFSCGILCDNAVCLPITRRVGPLEIGINIRCWLTQVTTHRTALTELNGINEWNCCVTQNNRHFYSVNCILIVHGKSWQMVDTIAHAPAQEKRRRRRKKRENFIICHLATENGPSSLILYFSLRFFAAVVADIVGWIFLRFVIRRPMHKHRRPRRFTFHLVRTLVYIATALAPPSATKIVLFAHRCGTLLIM